MKIEKKIILILLVFILSLFIFCETKYIYARYAIEKKVKVPIYTSDYYFVAKVKEKEIKSFPVTLHLTIKNNNGTKYTDTNLKYKISLENPNYIITEGANNIKQIAGGSKKTKKVTITIDKINVDNSASLNLIFDVITPYTDQKKVKIDLKTAVDYWSSEKGCNVPKLEESMTPIKWVNNQMQQTNEQDPDWYDYNTGKWANAKTADGNYWVWIPRFAFQITSLYHQRSETTGGNVNVKFVKNKDNTLEGISIANSNGLNNWNIPPAFNTFGGEKTGFWVAKFEASKSEKLQGEFAIIPGAHGWDNIAVDDIFKICMNYKNTSGSHMMKNSEWAAVAYLSQSQYGKGVNDIEVNSKIVDSGVEDDYRTGGGIGNAYINNILQSTTGNVYGIYDMSGGGSEFVAAYVDNGNAVLENNGNSLYHAEPKYKDVYTVSTKDTKKGNYNINSDRYGEALYDVTLNGSANNNSQNAWYSDYSCFPYGDVPFFVRSGKYFDGQGAGLFYFNFYNGSPLTLGTFRPVLSF